MDTRTKIVSAIRKCLEMEEGEEIYLLCDSFRQQNWVEKVVNEEIRILAQIDQAEADQVVCYRIAKDGRRWIVIRKRALMGRAFIKTANGEVVPFVPEDQTARAAVSRLVHAMRRDGYSEEQIEAHLKGRKEQ